MNLNNYSILTGGLLTFLMLIFHCFFYKIFNWEDDFKNISIRNKKILLTIHLALIAAFFIFAFISLLFFKEINSRTPLNLFILISISLFWFLRCIWQIFYFNQKGNKNKSMKIMHYILIIYFFIISFLYIIPVINL